MNKALFNWWWQTASVSSGLTVDTTLYTADDTTITADNG